MERIRLSWRQTFFVLAALVLAFGLAGCDAITSVLGGDGGGGSKSQPTLTLSTSAITIGFATNDSPTAQILVSAKDNTGNSEGFSASSQNISIVTVSNVMNNSFTINAVAAGSTSVFVTSASGLTKTVLVTVSAATPTYQPATNLVAALSGTVVTLTWDPAVDQNGDPPDSYKVYQSSSSTGTFVNVTGSDTDGNFSNQSFTKSLNAGQTAWFKVSGLFNGTEGPKSSAVLASTQSATFTAPTLSATGQAASISLSWTATGASQYQLYRADQANAIFSGTGTSFTDYLVAAGTVYSYTVKAIYSGGQATSTAVQASVNASNVVPPAAPTGLLVIGATSSSLTVTWNFVTGLTYDVKRNGNPVAINLSSGSYTDTGLTAQTYYMYEVVAKNSAGSASSLVQGQTLASGVTITTPGTPSIISVTSSAASPGQLTISWTIPSGVDASTRYSVYRDSQPTGGFTNKVADQLVSTSYTDVNLSSGTTYYYKVQATNYGLYNGTPIQAASSQSTYFSGTTPVVAVNYAPYMPSGPYPSTGSAALDPTTIGTLSWSWAGDPENDPLTYDLYMSVNGGPLQQQLYGTMNTYWTPPTGFFAYSTYYSWYVIVHDNHGNSTFGNTWTFSTAAPVTTPPSVSFSVTSGQTTFVTGSTITLSGSVSRGVYPFTNITSTANPTWTLYSPDGTSSVLGTGATMSFTPQSTGWYYLYLTGSDGGISSSYYQSFNVVSPSQGTAIININ